MISQKTVYVIWLIGFMVIFTACQSAPTDIEPTMSMTRTPITTAVTPPPFASPTSTAIVTPTATLDLRTIGIYPTAVWTPDPKLKMDTTNWPTFTDEKAGYTIQYPPNSLFSSGQRSGEIYSVTHGFFQASQSDSADMVIVVYDNPDNLSIEQFLLNRYLENGGSAEGSSEYLSYMEAITINGLPAIWDKASSYGEVFIALNASGKIYLFSAVTHGQPGGTRLLSNDNRAIFFQILNTFTFLFAQ